MRLEEFDALLAERDGDLHTVFPQDKLIRWWEEVFYHRYATERFVRVVTKQPLAVGREGPATADCSERSTVISRQNVYLFDAGLSPEHRGATLVLAKPDSLEEADTSNIATVRNATHLLHACDAKDKLQSLTDCSGRDTATLSGRCKSKANLSGELIGRDKDADVADKLVGFAIGDTELDPVTGCEQLCLAHLGEERQGFRLGHGRPTLKSAEFRNRAVSLEGSQVTRS
jgi:hypothetical protein